MNFSRNADSIARANPAPSIRADFPMRGRSVARSSRSRSRSRANASAISMYCCHDAAAQFVQLHRVQQARADARHKAKRGSSNIVSAFFRLARTEATVVSRSCASGARAFAGLRHHPTFGSDGRNRSALPVHAKRLAPRDGHPERCARSAAGEAGGVERSRTAWAERRPFTDIAPIVH